MMLGAVSTASTASGCTTYGQPAACPPGISPGTELDPGWQQFASQFVYPPCPAGTSVSKATGTCFTAGGMPINNYAAVCTASDPWNDCGYGAVLGPTGKLGICGPCGGGIGLGAIFNPLNNPTLFIGLGAGLLLLLMLVNR